MGSRSAKQDEERMDQVYFYRKLVAGMTAVVFAGVVGLIVAFSSRTIWVAPDLSTGQTITSNSPYRAYPYSFAYRFMDTVWTWTQSGESEYPRLIKAVEPYADSGILKQFKNELDTLKGRRALEGRTRSIKEIIPVDPSKMVRPIGNSQFVVFVDLEIIDKIKGAIVSWKRVRFSFVVAVDTSDMDSNGYGLTMVDYYKSPRNLDNQMK